jgi:hypothetical protein
VGVCAAPERVSPFQRGHLSRERVRKKAPRKCGALSFSTYLPRPEPGPLGVRVDPLGEGFGASVFPDGFMVLFGLVPTEPVEPTEPAARPVVLPFMDEPTVDPLAAVPPAAELPPAAPPALPLCASANVLESANAVASAIVLSFMISSFSSLREAATRRRFARSINSSSRDRSRQAVHVFQNENVPALAADQARDRVASYCFNTS